MNANPETSDQPTRLCFCGCGSEISERSYYRPGHDSRHVGIVARHIAESMEWNQIQDLPTLALQMKAWNAAYRLHTRTVKQVAKLAKASKPKPVRKSRQAPSAQMAPA